MKQLTLENIAWYLPYNPIIISGNTNKARKITFKNVEDFEHIHITALLKGIGHKIVLKPMSDLTKTFIKDGEETTHLQQIYKICFPNGVNGIKDPINQKGFLHKNKYHFHYTKKGFTIRIGSNETKFIAPNQLQCIQYLAKHKFDFQNLIGLGLAIDVNTLENNVYN